MKKSRFLWRACPSGLRCHCWGLEITLRHTTLGRTPLDEWATHRTDLYLTTHNTENRQTFMTPVGFEAAIPASRRPQTHVLDRAATGIGMKMRLSDQISKFGAGRIATWSCCCSETRESGCAVSLSVSYTSNCRRQRHLAYRIRRRVIISCFSRALNQFHALVKVMAERMWNRRVGNFTIILHTCNSPSPKLSPIWPPHAICRHRVMCN